jgi:cytochrome c-type biogenesis protein CcsB
MSVCTSELETYPVQAGGRVKPLYVLAEESLKFISGDTKVAELSATQAFCKLSLSAFGMPLSFNLDVKVDHVDVRTFLGMSKDTPKAPIEKILEKSGLISAELSKLKENNAYKKELNRVQQRLSTYNAITTGIAWTIPEEKNGKIDFIPLTEFLSQSKVAAMREKSDNPVMDLLTEGKNLYLKNNGDHYLLELKYYKWNLSTWALVCSLISIILLIAIRRSVFGSIFVISSLALQITTLAMRVMISGRAPVTNMYETVMFSGLGALVLGGIIAIYRKEKSFVVAGLAYDILCLMMMKFAHGMLDEGISPLVPVLRDNFWLSTHVTTVILSYAALALSWILANSLLIRSRFMKLSSADERYQVDLIYTCMKFGVVLLATGIILGGVWADYSWGRFWGWDPKETWSLIVLLVYMAILHGKYTSWIPTQRFVPLVAGAFMSVMMAWFGVNYILASGLHSYGFSEGGAIFLGTFFALQIILLLLQKRKSA